MAVILVTGQRPIVFTKACLSWTWNKIKEWKKNRGESGKIERRERELLKEKEKEREKRKREREQEKKAEDKKKAEEEAKDGGQGMLPLKETPAPQIIGRYRLIS